MADSSGNLKGVIFVFGTEENRNFPSFVTKKRSRMGTSLPTNTKRPRRRHQKPRHRFDSSDLVLSSISTKKQNKTN